MAPMKTNRGFAAYLILTFLTCGIYGLWFMHCMARDTNIICFDDGKHTQNVFVCILLTLCTCGIYQLFWWAGIADRTKTAAHRMGYHAPNEPSSVMGWMIGGLFISFLTWVGMYKTIENLNFASRAYNNLPNRPL